MTSALALVTALAIMIAPATAQEFEVASIEENRAIRGPLNAIDLNFQRAFVAAARNGRLSLSAVPPRLSIELAYDVTDSQLLGGPSWLDTIAWSLLPTFRLLIPGQGSSTHRRRSRQGSRYSPRFRNKLGCG